MNIFVAGGTGVLGRASLKPLIDVGLRVRSAARGPERTNLVRSVVAEPVDADLFEAAAVRKAREGSEVLIRLTTKIGSLTSIRRE